MPQERKQTRSAFNHYNMLYKTPYHVEKKTLLFSRKPAAKTCKVCFKVNSNTMYILQLDRDV